MSSESALGSVCRITPGDAVGITSSAEGSTLSMCKSSA